jgi:3-vinyl bacteriochlorophyllide hydratase
MPAYAFEALTADGQLRRGTVEADSAKAARTQLRAQALVPLKMEPVASSAQGEGAGGTGWFRRRVFNANALSVWTRQLASLVASGLPLERALASLSTEAERETERKQTDDLSREREILNKNLVKAQVGTTLQVDLIRTQENTKANLEVEIAGYRTTAGDLNGADLAAVMEEEKNLHGVVGPTLEIIGNRRTLVFAASVVLVLRYLATGAGYELATGSVVLKTLLLYAIMVTGCIWEKVVFGVYLFAEAFFWEDVFSMLVLALHTAYLAAVWFGWMDAHGRMVLALAAYAAYVINATQFVLKLRAARLDAESTRLAGVTQ